MGRDHNLAVQRTESELARPNSPKASLAQRQHEIAVAMARLKAKIQARSEERTQRERPRRKVPSPALTPTMLTPDRRRQQVSWLAKVYEFQTRRTLHDTDPQLHLDIDPKLYWILRHQRIFPLDVNEATPALLLRVPGFGVKATQRILEARKFRRLRFADLARMKVPLDRAKYFIKTDEPNPYLNSLPVEELLRHTPEPKIQLNLFAGSNSDDNS